MARPIRFQYPGAIYRVMARGDDRKVVTAALLRDRTSVGNRWIARRLAMGHPGSVSRMVGSCRKSDGLVSIMKLLAKALDEA